jgi:hypothetical protein
MGLILEWWHSVDWDRAVPILDLSKLWTWWGRTVLIAKVLGPGMPAVRLQSIDNRHHNSLLDQVWKLGEFPSIYNAHVEKRGAVRKVIIRILLISIARNACFLWVAPDCSVDVPDCREPRCEFSVVSALQGTNTTFLPQCCPTNCVYLKFFTWADGSLVISLCTVLDENWTRHLITKAEWFKSSVPRSPSNHSQRVGIHSLAEGTGSVQLSVPPYVFTREIQSLFWTDVLFNDLKISCFQVTKKNTPDIISVEPNSGPPGKYRFGLFKRLPPILLRSGYSGPLFGTFQPHTHTNTDPNDSTGWSLQNVSLTETTTLPLILRMLTLDFRLVLIFIL